MDATGWLQAHCILRQSQKADLRQYRYKTLGVVYGKAKRWWGSVLNEDKKPEQVEFDVMAESLDKKYLLVGECKWTTQENGKQLTAELLRKANLLPFAKNYTIVPVLFLKNAPKGDSENVMHILR